jgi:predicted O-methyltransferase YrrM
MRPPDRDRRQWADPVPRLWVMLRDVTGGGSSLPEVQRLLAVLAAGRRVAEAGTAFGEGAEAMARTARSVVTVELDSERAALAAERLAPYENVELLVGDWREELPPRGPFGLVFLDGGGFKHAPEESGDLVYGLLGSCGLLVMDDLTPGRVEFDPVREWVHGHSGLKAAEVLTTATSSALLIARL